MVGLLVAFGNCLSSGLSLGLVTCCVERGRPFLPAESRQCCRSGLNISEQVALL